MKQDEEKKQELEFSRLYFTAFFYSEYVLRNYEKNHPEVVECVTRVTSFIKNLYNCSEEESIYYLDYIIEQLAHSSPEEFQCTLCANSILKRNHDRRDAMRKIHDNTHNKIIISEKSRENVTAYKYILKDDYKEKINFKNCEKAIYRLEECLLIENYYNDLCTILNYSLLEGIYLSHITSFRPNKYNFNLLKSTDKKFFFNHIFYKKDHLLQDSPSFVSYKHLEKNEIKPNSEKYDHFEINFEDIEYDEDTECAPDDDLDIDFDFDINAINDDIYNTILDIYAINITVDIRQHHENFSIKSVLNSITSSILVASFPDITVAINSFDVSFQPYIDKFFKKSFYRTDEKELKHRLIGLLLWDLKNKYNIKKGDFQLYAEDYLNQYGVRLTPRDENQSCYELDGSPHCPKCASESCRKNIKNLIKITDDSICLKYIKTFSKK